MRAFCSGFGDRKIGVEGGGNQNARRYSCTQFVIMNGAGDPGALKPAITVIPGPLERSPGSISADGAGRDVKLIALS